MRAQEFISEIERADFDMYSGGKAALPVQVNPENLGRIKPVPGGSGLGYYTVPGPVIYIVDPKKPQEQRDRPDDIIVGILKLANAENTIPLPNARRVDAITVDEQYQGRGVARSLYGIALTILKFTLVAGEAQTPDGRRMWQMLYSIPGVEMFGLVEDTYIDDSISRAILKRGGRVVHQTQDEYGVNRTYAFPIRRGQDEIVSAIKDIEIYNDMDDNGITLVAKWTGQ